MSPDSDGLTGEEQVTERARAARRLSRLYEAEANGLLWAISNQHEVVWSKDKAEQEAFLRGVREGRSILCAASGGTDEDPG